jgi:hypothetical protein
MFTGHALYRLRLQESYVLVCYSVEHMEYVLPCVISFLPKAENIHVNINVGSCKVLHNTVWSKTHQKKYKG